MGRVRVAVAGAGGWLGSAIAAAVATSPSHELVAAFVRPNGALAGSEVPGTSGALRYAGTWQETPPFDCLVDASRAESASAWAEAAAERGCALLTAVTGLGAEAEASLDRAAGKVAVLVAPNLSLGAVLLLRLTREAARHLPGYHLEIVETHHAGKRDSPSGTALWLARAAAEARGVSLDAVLQTGEARVGPRDPKQIAIHSVRAGTAPGEHRVRFGGQGESVELVHVVESRGAFAAGALRATEWLAGARAGRYNMEDILVAS